MELAKNFKHLFSYKFSLLTPLCSLCWCWCCCCYFCCCCICCPWPLDTTSCVHLFKFSKRAQGVSHWQWHERQRVKLSKLSADTNHHGEFTFRFVVAVVRPLVHFALTEFFSLVSFWFHNLIQLEKFNVSRIITTFFFFDLLWLNFRESLEYFNNFIWKRDLLWCACLRLCVWQG